MIIIILTITFLIVSVTLFLLIYFGIIHVNETPNTVLDDFLKQVSLQNGWSEPAYVDNERAGCYFYNTFSLETSIVDSLPMGASLVGLPPEIACNDGFSQPLAKMYHICNEAECAGTDGKIYLRGEREDYYVNCATLEKCPNGLSGVIFEPESNKYCLATSDNQTVYITSCPSTVSPQDNTFFSVDYQDIGGGFSLVRIRFPGQDRCFLDDLSVGECLSRDDLGYTWLYCPKLIVENELYPPGDVFYPPQLLEYPVGLDLSIVTDVNDLVLQLSKYRSLQTNGTEYFLAPYSLCTLTSGPLESNCQVSTEILSAYNWSQLF